MSLNLAGLNLKQLKALRTKVDAAIQKFEATNLSNARAQAAQLAKEYDVPLSSLIAEDAVKKPKRRGSGKTRKPVAPKYRHPEDAKLKWTGRGLKPKWVVALLESGVELEELEIK